MTGLPSSIVKKHGIGKKAWAVFRSQKRSHSTKKTKVRYMARRKAKSHPRRSKGMNGLVMTLAGAAAYGAIRGKLSAYLDPYTSKIPLGGISDEVGMIAVCMLVNKFAGRKVPMLGQVCKAGMIIEAAQIGQAFAAGQVSLGGNGLGSSNTVG